jgi:hypothetical protein
MKVVFFLLFIIVNSCANLQVDIEDCHTYRKKTIGGYENLSKQELEEKEERFIEQGRINTDPTLSCFETALSINLIGCRLHDTDAVVSKYSLDPFVKLEKWRSSLEVNKVEFSKILNHSMDVSMLNKVAEHQYVDFSMYKKYNRSMYIEFLTEQANEMPAKEKYKLATCKRYWRGNREWITSVIFIK